MFIQWDDSLFTGIKWIDEQHKIFIEKMDKYLEVICGGKGPAEAVTALKEVEDYVNFHFSTEEKYMLQYDYPSRKLHMSQHKAYKEKFNELKDKYGIEGASNDFLREFQLGIIDWYVNHIKNHDKIFADFLSIIR